MDIFEKIDQIREKPEHIRMLYVWGLVLICMTLIVSVWVFFLKSSLKNSADLNIVDEIKTGIDSAGNVETKTKTPGFNEKMKPSVSAGQNGGNPSTGGKDLKNISNQ